MVPDCSSSILHSTDVGRGASPRYVRSGSARHKPEFDRRLASTKEWPTDWRLYGVLLGWQRNRGACDDKSLRPLRLVRCLRLGSCFQRRGAGVVGRQFAPDESGCERPAFQLALCASAGITVSSSTRCAHGWRA